MEMNAPGATGRRHFRHRLDHSRLVVGQHHRHQSRLAADGADHRGGGHFAASCRSHACHGVAAAFQLFDGLEHRGMFDRRCDNVMTTTATCAENAENCGIVGFCAAAGEDDLARSCPDQPGH